MSEALVQVVPTSPPTLARRGPLDGEPPQSIGSWRISVRQDQPVWLVRSSDPLAIAGALYRGPGELLVIGDEIVPPVGAILHDMRAAFICIDLEGPGCLEAIGLGAFPPLGAGDGLTTRLADIRVSIAGTSAGLLLITESYHADWLWSWLRDRLPLARG